MATIAPATTYPTYTLRDGESGVEAPCGGETAQERREEAETWAHDGDWGTVERTIWVDVQIIETTIDDDGDVCHEIIETVTVAIDPDAPDCTASEHDWQSPEFLGGLKENPGVWGHGGGVKITECCMHCGCARHTDTWAQRPDTGEQGLRSVEYEPGKYEDELASEKLASAEGALDDCSAVVEYDRKRTMIVVTVTDEQQIENAIGVLETLLGNGYVVEEYLGHEHQVTIEVRS